MVRKKVLSNMMMAGGLLGLFIGSAQAIEIGKVKMNGFVDFEFEKSDHDTLGDPKGSFDQYHFNLLSEFPVSDTVTTKLHLEYEHSPEVPGSGDIKVEWSYIEFLLSNTTRVRAGKNLTPFGIYNENHDATPTYVSMRTPWGIYKAGSVGGYSTFPKFTTGVYLLGNHFTQGGTNVNYIVYLANGENTTKNAAEKDENENKAMGGRVGVTPVEDLNLFASFFQGDVGVTESDHSAWGLSAEYIPYPMAVRAEYATSDRDDKSEEESWYTELAYVVNKWTPFVRYGWLDPDKDADDDEWTEVVVGFNYTLQQGVVLKLENRMFEGESLNASVSDDFNEIGAAVTVAF